MRLMADSDNLDDIPDQFPLIAYYGDGEPGSATGLQLARFHNATWVSITRKYGVQAKVIDVETGAATPADAARQISKGLSDTVYCAASNLVNVEKACQGLTFHRWVADWGSNSLWPGSVATQFASPTQGNVPGHYDLSYVVDNGWPENGGTVVAPSFGPAADIQPTPSGNGYWILNEDGGVFTYGDAPFFGSIFGTVPKGTAVAIRCTPTGKGYWILTSSTNQGLNDGVFAFGDAKFYGHPGDTGR